MASPYPITPKHPITDEYHGLPVVDEYRWLEDFDDPAVQEWNAAQNRHTRSVLDALPHLDELRARFKALYGGISSNYFGLRHAGGRLFALKFQPPKQQNLLVCLASAAEVASEQVVLDPNAYDPSGGTAIDWFVPSYDGKFVALSLSQHGSEDGALHIFDTTTGQPLPDRIPRVQYPTGGGSAAWTPDNGGLFYTRYPHAGERPDEDLNFYQQVYFHKLGTSLEDDVYVIGQDFPRIAEIQLRASADGRWLLAIVANGDGGDFAHHLRSPDGPWIPLTRFEDQLKQAVIGPDDHLYLLSRENAPRGKLLRLPLSAGSLAAAITIVPESNVAIRDFEPTDTRLYVVDTDGGPSQVRVFEHTGKLHGQVPLEPVSSVQEIVHLEGDVVLYRAMSFITPGAWYRFDPATGSATRTELYMTSPADFNDCDVVREYAISRDGTRVPVNIIKRKDTVLDGNNPVLLTGYGGYGVSLAPYFNTRRRVWVDAGGIIAVANLRGGGEYGDAWHKAGNLTNKQNVFDDFIGCAQHLIDRQYTRSEKLVIEGGSNGGLLMGAAFTQRPELFGAVITHVGIYDMLRVELDPNGAFNVTEFGTVKNPQHFEALYDYSPFHRVVDGTPYPALLLLTGENDGRVNPAQSRKMTARLQAATASERPVLLRTSASSGHGLGTALDDVIAQDAVVFTFLFSQLGI
ncbi:MAG: prolyl oligopeptidase family serine peptidase, partial [Anaerolineales bacterium]